MNERGETKLLLWRVGSGGLVVVLLQRMQRCFMSSRRGGVSTTNQLLPPTTIVVPNTARMATTVGRTAASPSGDDGQRFLLVMQWIEQQQMRTVQSHQRLAQSNSIYVGMRLPKKTGSFGRLVETIKGHGKDVKLLSGRLGTGKVMYGSQKWRRFVYVAGD